MRADAQQTNTNCSQVVRIWSTVFGTALAFGTSMGGGGRPGLLWFALVIVGACVGEIGGVEPVATPGSVEQCTSTDSPGAPVPMRRLTAVQVERSVAAILGVDVTVGVADETLFAFKSNISSSVDFVAARGYLDVAEAAVAAADLSPCSEPGQACDAWLFDDVGRRLFRRALDDDEQTRYKALFAEAVAEDGSLEGARWVLEAMLQSPTFLYLDEVATSDGYLDGTSMAARLALTLWGSNPDSELLDKAAAGELSTPEQLESEAERMLADPRSVGGLTDFVDQWLRLSRLDDPDARPDLEALGAETLAALRAEPVQLFHMLVAQDGDFEALLTTTLTPALSELGSLYGDDIVDDSGTHYTLDAERRAGILSRPGVMAGLAHAEATSPTLRGFAILANVLCTPPPPPPAGVSVTLPDIGPGKTTRERLEQHFSDPSCSSCHAAMDNIGFAFEGIDWLGQSRDEEFGKPIDDFATFPLDGEQITVQGSAGLGQALAESETAASCIARQWVSYAGGIPDKAEATCLVEHLAGEVQQTAGLRAMIIGFVTSDWYRKAAEEQP